MRIGRKLLLSFGGLIGLSGIILGQTALSLRGIVDEYDRVANHTVPIIIAFEDLRFSALRIVASTSEYALLALIQGREEETVEIEGQEESEEELIHTGLESFSQGLADYDRNVEDRDPRHLQMREKIVEQGERLIAASHAVKQALDSGLPYAVLLERKEEMEDAEVAILAILDGHITEERLNLGLRSGDIKATLRVNFAILIALASLGLVGISLFSTRQIVQPLNTLTVAARRVATGDFSRLPHSLSGDEIGTLINEFRNMSEKIRDLLEENKAATDVAKQNEQRFRDVAEVSSDWIWETDCNQKVTYLSERFAELTGREPSDLLGQNIAEFLKPESFEGEETLGNFADLLSDQLRDLRCSYTGSGNEARICRLSGRPSLNNSDGLVGYRGTVTDITSEVEAQRQAEFLGLHDSLTGLPNRLLLSERMTQDLRAVKRNGLSINLLCLDLDKFKEVNDTLGHAVGDKLLIQVAERLEGLVRAGDTVARLGGDEFAILQISDDQVSDAEHLSRRVLEAVAQGYDIDGQSVFVGVSIGISLTTPDQMDAGHLLKSADVAMYRAKKEGRNTYCFFEAGMDAELQHRKSMEADLRLAIQNDELEMHYQPIVRALDQKIIGVEALVRWNRSGHGMVMPSDFIPFAEETGLIIPLGEWILATSCREVLQWPGLFIAVNLSPVQFRQQNLIGLVDRVLQETGLTPHLLELEITEGVLLDDTDLALHVLDGLKELGVRVAMDDFGTGYSSLSYLQRFAFNKIKLDQSFINEIEMSDESATIIKTILALGESLGITTTAEGVETAEQLGFLTIEGCDQLQGYHFSKPLPANQVGDFLIASAVIETIKPLKVVGDE